MKIPKLEWIKFDPKNLPDDLNSNPDSYLVLIEDRGYLRDGHYDKPKYYLDLGTAYGDYLDDFWDTTVDWGEGNNIHVIAYVDLDGEVKVENVITAPEMKCFGQYYSNSGVACEPGSSGACMHYSECLNAWRTNVCSMIDAN